MESGFGQPQVAAVEQKEEVSALNINNPDILEKLAKIAGVEVNNMNISAFEAVKKMAQEGKSATWDTSASTFIILDQNDIENMQLKGKKPGDIILANADNVSNGQRMRAQEMGM